MSHGQRLEIRTPGQEVGEVIWASAKRGEGNGEVSEAGSGGGCYAERRGWRATPSTNVGSSEIDLQAFQGRRVVEWDVVRGLVYPCEVDSELERLQG